MPTPSAFAAEVVACYPRLYRFALVLTRDRERAEDLVQDTMLRAFEKHALFDGENLLAWLARIMRNKHADDKRYIRHRIRKRHLTALESQRKTAPSQEHICACREALEAVFAETNGAQELLMQAMGYYDYEIAEARGIPVGTVASRAFRSRQHLLNLERQT